ncbi:MAG: M48 family metalloprotease, partial [Bacteroidota bacterium]
MTGKSRKYHTLIWALCITAATGTAQQPDPNYLEPDKEAKVAVSRIVQYTGLAPNFIIVEGDVSTALAYIKDNKRYIAYNPAFIRKLRTKTRTDWGAVSVLAHEIGHHLSGHTLAARKN